MGYLYTTILVGYVLYIVFTWLRILYNPKQQSGFK